MLRATLSIVAIVMCSGCASTAQWVQDNPEEAAWQALHAVDVLQTANFTKDLDCYSEVDPLTSKIIGKKPERERVYKWALGSAIAHYAIFKAIEGTRFDKPLRIADMAFKVNIAYSNHDVGIGIAGKNNLNKGKCKRL